MNPTIFKTLFNSTYSAIFNKNTYNNMNFLFPLTDFCNRSFLTTMNSVSMLNQVYTNNTQSLKKAL